MSAKNRKTESVKDDKYYTPTWAVELFVKQALPKYLNHLFLGGNKTDFATNHIWLEPCVGSGNIIKAVNNTMFGIPTWQCVELRA
jgi:hypothetical protein